MLQQSLGIEVARDADSAANVTSTRKDSARLTSHIPPLTTPSNALRSILLYRRPCTLTPSLVNPTPTQTPHLSLSLCLSLPLALEGRQERRPLSAAGMSVS